MSTAPAPAGAAAARLALTRVTVVGTVRRADVVLAADAPVDTLVPELLDLLAEPGAPSPRSWVLAGAGGRALAGQDTLAGADVPDGAVLRLTPLADAPPPAEVLDVTEVVAAGTAERAGRWGPRPARTLATGLVVATALPAAALAGAAGVPGGWLAAGAGVLAALGVLACVPTGTRPLGPPLVVAGAVVALVPVAAVPQPGGRALALAALANGLLVALGACRGSRRPGRAGVVGGLLGLVLVAAWAAGPGWVGLELTAVVLGVVAVVAVGVLPRLALDVAGVLRLDDAVGRGEEVRRTGVLAAVTTAHRTSALGCAVLGASAAASGWLLASAPDRWTVPLAVLLAVVLLLRARTFPLTVEVAALVASAAVVLAGLARTWVQEQPGAVGVVALLLAAVAAAAVASTLLRPSAVVRARARGLADRAELLGVVALVPLAVGSTGLYADLLVSL